MKKDTKKLDPDGNFGNKDGKCTGVQGRNKDADRAQCFDANEPQQCDNRVLDYGASGDKDFFPTVSWTRLADTGDKDNDILLTPG